LVPRPPCPCHWVCNLSLRQPDPSNSIWAVYSTCDAQLSYFRDISEPGSRGLTQASQTLDAEQYENETASHSTGIALPRISSRRTLLTAESTLRLAEPSHPLCSDQTGVAILACHVYRKQESALAERTIKVMALGSTEGGRLGDVEQRGIGVGRRHSVGAPMRQSTYRCAICTLPETMFC
jgi:hypothetical protein